MTSARLSCRIASLVACGLLVPQGAVRAVAVEPAAARLPASPAGQATMSSVFRQAAKLTASDGAQGDELGNAVAVSADGSTVVAAVWAATVSGHAVQGALYVFERPAGGWSNDTNAAKLTASDGAAQDLFGYSVAVSSDGSTVVAGAIFATEVGNRNGPGAAYVFVRPAGGWKDATETARLTASDRHQGDNFGISVAMSGDGSTVAVGAQQAFVGTKLGAVYVFVRPGSGWTSATETAKLQGSDEGSQDLLGHCVGLSRDGSTIVAGADGATVSGSNGLGAVYVFLRRRLGERDRDRQAHHRGGRSFRLVRRGER